MAQVIGWQKIEGGMIFAAGLGLFILSGAEIPWWSALALFLVPDIAMLGYLGGPRTGAVAYNAAHIYGAGAILAAIGALGGSALTASLGFLWLAHCGFDRMLGYGLKLPGAFGATHLGPIGRKRI